MLQMKILLEAVLVKNYLALRTDASNVLLSKLPLPAVLLEAALAKILLRAVLLEAVLAKTFSLVYARKRQQQETEALRQQHRPVVSRLRDAKTLQETKPQHKPAFDTSASFPLQERHQVQPPPAPGPLTTQIGPLCMSLTEAASMRVVQDTLVDNTTPCILYSGTMDVLQAFGVVDLTQEHPLKVLGRTDGHASSAKAELR
ncbi:hypothetical protein F5H01DRAFT_381786 [Linnemannia elongata]|nr:hypothetical protein F5H01DRAFT_381786 [Linnemannia elongata]